MSSLSGVLSQLDTLESAGKFQELSKRILSLMMKGFDLSPLGSKIIKYLAVPYPPFKKVIFAFLVKYSESIADLNILATNSLLKDFKDPNPYIRKLVIKTVCGIPCMTELAFQLLPQALNDTSPYVRSCATISTSAVIRSDNIESNSEVIHKLYEMIRDMDASVVCSSLSALEVILHSEGGIAVNSRIALYLLSRISDFDEWKFVIVYSVLQKYLPKDTDELLLFLNLLDCRLLDLNPAVFTLTTDLVLLYVKKLGNNLSEDILKQVAPQLKFLLHNSSNETLASLLDIVRSYLPEHRSVFVSFYKTFFCLSGDSPFIKIQKLKLLVYLINSSNAADIVDEIQSNCCSTDTKVSHQAVTSFVAVLNVNVNIDMKVRLKNFVSLIDIHYNNMDSKILNALSRVELQNLESINEHVFEALSEYSSSVNTAEGKLSILKLIEKYGKEISAAPYIIEDFFGEKSNCENDMFMSLLLRTAVKLFCVRPQEMQLLLGSILESAAKSPSLMIRKQTSVLYHLLKNLHLIKDVIL